MPNGKDKPAALPDFWAERRALTEAILGKLRGTLARATLGSRPTPKPALAKARRRRPAASGR